MRVSLGRPPRRLRRERGDLKSVLANALLVGSGGFAGALLRYGPSGLVHRQLPFATFPYGTLTVNVLGCLLIGVFSGLAESRQVFAPDLRTFALVGVLGGFTTFSTFGYETFSMLRDGESLRATANVSVHVLAGLGSVWFGYVLASSR
jgi:CrcB protein